jgi:hypothetical protein
LDRAETQCIAWVKVSFQGCAGGGFPDFPVVFRVTVDMSFCEGRINIAAYFNISRRDTPEPRTELRQEMGTRLLIAHIFPMLSFYFHG